MTTYTPWNTLQSSLASEPLPAKYQRWGYVYFALLFIIGLAAFSFGCWVLWQSLNYGWQTDYGRRFSRASLVAGVGFELLLFPLMWLTLFEWSKRIVVSPAPLRSLMAAGDDHLLPLAKQQPEALTSDELASGPHQLTSLRLSRISGITSRVRALTSAGVYGLIMPMTLANMLNSLPLALGITLTSSQADTLLFVSMALLLSPIVLFGISAIIFVIVAGWWHTPYLIGEDGISWQSKGWRPREHTIPWSKAQSFSLVTTSDLYGQRNAFLLDMGDDGIFTWGLAGYVPYGRRREANMLERLVVSYTNLPLRDLSPVVRAINRSRGNPQKLRAAGLPEDIVAVAAKKPFPRQFLWIGGIALLILALLFGTAIWATSALQP